MPYSAFPVTYSLVCCRKPLILLTLWEYRYPTLIFNRPGFAALLEEVEAGRVETLVVKDLSRFASASWLLHRNIMDKDTKGRPRNGLLTTNKG